MDKYKYLISLGEDCFMRSLIDRYTIREKFKVRMPFDGSIHPYQEMCRLIETDFVDYDKDIVLNNKIFYGKNGIEFNHEKTTDIDNFKNQLYKRVEQFRMILNEENVKILFLIHNKNKTIEFDYRLIEHALKKTYPNLNYHICVFNNYYPIYINNTLNNITYVNIFWNPHNITNFSNLNYEYINNDFINQMYITPYGIYFSQCVLKEICTILNEDHTKYILNTNYNFDNHLL